MNLRINSALLCQLSYRGLLLKQRAYFTKDSDISKSGSR